MLSNFNGMNWLSPAEIEETDPVELGSGGFCFVVAEILAVRIPGSAFYRLTDLERKRWGHVFVLANGQYWDIKGINTLTAMLRHFNDPDLVTPEHVDAQSVRQFFHPRYSLDQLRSAKTTLQTYIETHSDVFPSRRLPGSD